EPGVRVSPHRAQAATKLTASLLCAGSSVRQDMDLSVAVRMQQHQVGRFIRASMGPPDLVMDMPSGSLGDLLVALRTLAFLLMPQPIQFPPPRESGTHTALQTLVEVLLPCRVKRVRICFDLHVTSNLVI